MSQRIAHVVNSGNVTAYFDVILEVKIPFKSPAFLDTSKPTTPVHPAINKSPGSARAPALAAHTGTPCARAYRRADPEPPKQHHRIDAQIEHIVVQQISEPPKSRIQQTARRKRPRPGLTAFPSKKQSPKPVLPPESPRRVPVPPATSLPRASSSSRAPEYRWSRSEPLLPRCKCGAS